jgi:hypothetical protein
MVAVATVAADRNRLAGANVVSVATVALRASAG